MTVRYVSYFRVSTEKQGRSGLGLEAQREIIERHVRMHGEVIAEFTEVESGKKDDRPQLEAALDRAKAEKATLIIAKLDRLSRDVHFISGLMKAGVEIVCCDMPFANRFTLHIMAAVAQQERELISERTKQAMAALKARGVKLGPKDGGEHSAIVRAFKAKHKAMELMPLIDELRQSGVSSFAGLAKALNERGVKTPRGGAWQAVQVCRILDRC